MCSARWWSRSRPATARSVSRSRPAAISALDRREAPGALHRRPERHRHREDLGPDVQRHAVLRAQGHRAEHDLGRRPRAVGLAGQGAPRAGQPCWAGRCATSWSSTPPARARPGQGMGFIGGKMPLHHGPAEGEEGLADNIEKLAHMRERVGTDFWLMFDCWMSLDVDYATRLAQAARRVRPEVDRGGAAARRLLGLRATAAQRTARHAGHHRRARGHALGFSPAARDGLLRHPAARRRLVRRHHRAHRGSRRWPTRTTRWSCRMVRRSTATTSSSRATTARSPSF